MEEGTLHLAQSLAKQSLDEDELAEAMDGSPKPLRKNPNLSLKLEGKRQGFSIELILTKSVKCSKKSSKDNMDKSEIEQSTLHMILEGAGHETYDCRCEAVASTDGSITYQCKYEMGDSKTSKITGEFSMNVPRTRSLNAPSPIQQFGPCGRIMKNSAMVMTIQDPASQRLTWYKAPMTVLVIKKVRDASVIHPFIQLVKWLVGEKNMVVYVEAAVLDDPPLKENPNFTQIKEKLMTFSEGKDDLTDKIDFIVCLGGDGTLLYASSLFQQSVPPVMAFHLGSLGFLTPFEVDNFEQQITNVLEGNAALTLRSRLRCIVMKKDQTTNENGTSKASPSSGATIPSSGVIKPATNLLVLNEVVIDRGPSPYLSNIDLYLDGKLITSVQGDGLIISTPTGSTAYAVAAGASMIHPSVPAIMVTPICPHSLSFRPIVVPAGVELKVTLNPSTRNTAYMSFDGRNHQALEEGDSLRVTTSIYPVPSICAQDQISDWFASLAECLHWNVRKKQKHFDELSDLTRSSSNETLDSLDKLEST